MGALEAVGVTALFLLISIAATALIGVLASWLGGKS